MGWRRVGFGDRFACVEGKGFWERFRMAEENLDSDVGVEDGGTDEDAGMPQDVLSCFGHPLHCDASILGRDVMHRWELRERFM